MYRQILSVYRLAPDKMDKVRLAKNNWDGGKRNKYWARALESNKLDYAVAIDIGIE